ncbi:site-specific integrase [Carboxylicivirga sediminis]|uniref:Site-specific integrase n=1 Tax=Carboxylicivirga sediminis TaxID=2006564 RepID=A0A941F1E1_9BACT|nr:site-specific integrase [Carboxylicivirga sediminis]MBR8534443.1 site-specific integrase [Carboxylicivirga sediminis]
MNLIFWAVKNKANKKNEIPIYCRITINGERAEFSTGVRCKEEEWDGKKYKVKGVSDFASIANRKLEQLSHKLTKLYYDQVLNNDVTPTALELKALLNTKKKRIVFLVELLNDYAQEYYKMYSKADKLRLHERFIDTISKALKDIDALNIRLTNCDTYFLDRLANNFINGKGYSVGYTRKLFGFIKVSLKYAFNRRYIDRNYAQEYKIPYKEDSQVIYLEEWELNKIIKHEFCDTLQRSADMFVVQCYTGLAYVDLKKLSATHLVRDDNGSMWINITRSKVKTAECVIPVVKKVLEILRKYEFKLPVLSNQKYNEALKKIAVEVGIRKRLTTHVGRKTYGTLLLNKDVPIETVSKLLGHSDIHVTQKHYAKVLHMKIAKDVRLIL